MSAESQLRGRVRLWMASLRQGAVVYRLALACVAVAVVVVSFKVRPLTPDQILPLVVLLGLGVLSGTTLDDSTEGVTYSFTSFVLASSFALVGPMGAAIIGLVVPLFHKRGRWTSLHLFNTSLTVVIAGGGGLSYLMSSGWLPIPDSASPGAFLLHVGLPLLIANIVVMVLNALLIAIVIHVDGGQFRYVLAGAVRQTAVLYLGYSLLAFLFVMLWGPCQLYELSVALIMAPLLIARWSYMQYGEEFRAHNRILDALATAGDGWDRGGTGHGTRVDMYTQLMVEQLGLSFSEQRDLRYASKLHDIGRLGTPRSVLDKPMSARDDHDRAVISRHPILAAEIVGGIEFLAEAARDIRHHHERPDGLGYPDGLLGDQVPLVSRVLAVADAYDALTSGAGPLVPLDPKEALAELRRGVGTQFDPRCVEALGHVLGRTAEIVEHARRVQDDGPWRDHDDPRLGHLMLGVRPDDVPASPASPVSPASPASPAEPGGAGMSTGPKAATLRWPRALGPSQDGLTLVMIVVLIVAMFATTITTLGSRAGGLDANLPLLVVFVLTVVLAEQVRLRLPGRAETAPLVTAVGLGMAFSTDHPDGPVMYTAGGCILAMGLAIAVGVIPRHLRHLGEPLPDALDTVVRLFSVAVAAVVWRMPWPWLSAEPLMSVSADWPRWQRACLIAVIGIVAVFAEAPIMAARRAAQQRMRWLQATRDEATLTMGLSFSVAVTGTMIAVCLPLLGVVAVPLMVLPMLFTQNAVRRQTAIRETYGQTVRALSSMPEVVGIIPRGHADEVARLSVGIGRKLGMSEREVNDLEFAALLHDIGQVTLRYPIPGGATVQAAPVDQQRIADDGAAIVRETGVLGSVADIVATQAAPYRRVVESHERLPVSGRILKVTNAYADYYQAHADAGGSAGHCRAATMERIYLGLGYQFDPAVVAALEQVLDQAD